MVFYVDIGGVAKKGYTCSGASSGRLSTREAYMNAFLGKIILPERILHECMVMTRPPRRKTRYALVF